MNKAKVVQKAEAGEGLTVAEIKVYQKAVKPEKQVYGKYGTLAKRYLEDKGIDWTIANLPEYLHGIDKAADELYETLYEKFSKEEQFRRSEDFMENLKRQTEMQGLIEEEILNEIVYVKYRRYRYESIENRRNNRQICISGCAYYRAFRNEYHRRTDLRNHVARLKRRFLWKRKKQRRVERQEEVTRNATKISVNRRVGISER